MFLNKIRLIYELLAEQLNHWMLFPIALTMMEMTRGQTGMENPDMLLWILCGLFPPFLFGLRFFCRRHTMKLYLLILCHMAAAAAFGFILLLPGRSFITRAICILNALGYMLYSLRMQIKENTIYTIAWPLPAGVVLSLAAALMKHTNQWNHYYIFSLIGVTALFFLVLYIRQYQDFLILNKDSTENASVRKIFRSGTSLVAGYTFLGTIIMIICTHFGWLSKILKPITDFFMRFSKSLNNKLPEGSTESTVASDSYPLGEPFLVEPQEPFVFWEILQKVFTVILAVALFWLIIKLLLKLLQILQDYLNRRLTGQEIIEENVFDFREKCNSEKDSGKKKPNLSIAFTNRERVRKLYKKKLLLSMQNSKRGNRGRTVLGLFTAREWERKLQAEGMADIYEKTRYSQKEITADDVKKMKEICK